jgi:FkbM family methyltransferase
VGHYRLPLQPTKTKLFFSNRGKIKIMKKIVIDIGLGMLAINTLEILNRYQNSTVISVDPNPICLKYNEAYLSPYVASGRCVIYPYALADRPSGEKGRMYVTANDPGCSSLYLQTATFQTEYIRPVLGYIEIEYKTLNDVFDLCPAKTAPYVDFVKIDAQGSDLAIIRGGRESLAEKTVVVTIECGNTDYVGSDASIENVTTEMENLGFERTFEFDTKDPTFLNLRFRALARDVIAFQNN